MVELEPPHPTDVRTAAVRGGMSAAAHNGAISVPIYQSAPFERPVDLAGHAGAWDYSRIANPTRSALEECVVGLEGGTDAVATPSGMAATMLAVLATCRAGSHVVLSDNVYGGTWDLFTQVLPDWGVELTVVDMRDLAATRDAIGDSTSLVWIETPSNPLLKVVDVQAVARLAHERGATVAVDSTFATPVLQQPFGLGADLVVHSTTKYLGGHSDVTGGVVVVSGAPLAARVRRLAGMTGSVAAPMDSWLVLRGIRTLPLRMEAVCRSAGEIAEVLAGHPRVRAVHYPGLPGHPDHAVAARQMSGFGGVVSFEYDGTADEASRVCARTKVFTLAVSLGGVESLIQHPGRMTHCTTGGTPVAVPESLIRLSIGLENPRDLLDDLLLALD